MTAIREGGKKSFLFWLNVHGTAKCSVFRTDVNRSDTNCLRCFYSIHNGWRYTCALRPESLSYIPRTWFTQSNTQFVPNFWCVCSVTPCRMTDKSQIFMEPAAGHLPRGNRDSGSRRWYRTIRNHIFTNVILVSEEPRSQPYEINANNKLCWH